MTSERKKLYFDDVKEGDEVPKFVVENITRTDICKYAGASGDFNPIHHDQTFAEKAGYPSVFAHGMLSAGLVSKCVTDYVGRPSLRIFRVSFRSQVWPGDTITVGGKVTRKFEDKGEKRVEGELVATNQKGEPVIQGAFVAALPSR
jgi:acyl dehydratase